MSLAEIFEVRDALERCVRKPLFIMLDTEFIFSLAVSVLHPSISISQVESAVVKTISN
jgi:hypothetical protein